jgi:glucose/arabinose dehydrogenase
MSRHCPLAALVAVFCASLMLAGPIAAQSSTTPIQTREHAVRLVTVTEGLERPWGLAFLPDGRLLVTEKAGRLRVIGKDGKLDPTPVGGLPKIDAQGQGGLLDVALHPDFARTGWVYLTYAQRDAEGRNGTELARGKLAGSAGAHRLEQVEVLFRMGPKTERVHHFGSRIVFDAPKGQPIALYMTLGDRGDMQRAQALDDHAGKILRLTDEGKPAPGNPFLNDPKARPEIFSLGNRNVQGAALHPVTGVLWASEHGPQGGDELNVIKPGTNYGWPVITYGVNYVTGTKIGEGTAKDGMAQPVKHWSPSPALSGMAFYTGDRFPKWRGDVLMGALRGQGVLRVRLDGERAVDEELMLSGQIGRVRDVRVGPDGMVYLLTDLPNGAVLRIEPVQ